MIINNLTIRSNIQNNIISKVIDSNYHSWFKAPPGTGKSKIFIDILKHFAKERQFRKALICVDNTPLRDINWIDELNKWGFDSTKVEILCYQTIYKWNPDDFLGFDIVICDEVDFACTKSYSASLIEAVKKGTIKYCVGGSATLDSVKVSTINRFCGMCCYQLSVKEAMDIGLINRVICNLKLVPLDNEKKVAWEYDDETMTGTEVEEFLRLNKFLDKINKLVDIKKRIDFSTSPVTDEPWFKEYVDGIVAKKIESPSLLLKLKTNYREAITRIKKILANSIYAGKYSEEYKSTKKKIYQFICLLHSTAKEARSLSEKINAKNKKVLISGIRKEQVQRITENTYFTGDSNDVLESFNNGEILDLGVVGRVERGISFKELDRGIATCIHRSNTRFLQLLIGRLTRLPVDQVAKLVILVPYYDNNGEVEVIEQYRKYINKALVSYRYNLFDKDGNKLNEVPGFSYL